MVIKMGAVDWDMAEGFDNSCKKNRLGAAKTVPLGEGKMFTLLLLLPATLSAPIKAFFACTKTLHIQHASRRF